MTISFEFFLRQITYLYFISSPSQRFLLFIRLKDILTYFDFFDFLYMFI